MTGYRKSAPRSRRLFGGPALPPPEPVGGSPPTARGVQSSAAGGPDDSSKANAPTVTPPRLLIVQGELRVLDGGAKPVPLSEWLARRDRRVADCLRSRGPGDMRAARHFLEGTGVDHGR